MKKFNKVIALLLSLILIGSMCAAIGVAAEDELDAAPVEDEIPEDVDEEYQINVTSWTQLKFAIIFKIIDKIFKVFQDLINGEKSFGEIFNF